MCVGVYGESGVTLSRSQLVTRVSEGVSVVLVCVTSPIAGHIVKYVRT